MTTILGVRTGPAYTGLIIRDGDRLVDAATIARRPREQDDAYTVRILHAAQFLTARLTPTQLADSRIVVEGIRPGQRGDRLRRQHREHQAVLELVLLALDRLQAPVELVGWATDASPVPAALRGPRLARLSANEHPHGRREPEQQAWRATSRWLANPPPAPMPAPAPARAAISPRPTPLSSPRSAMVVDDSATLSAAVPEATRDEEAPARGAAEACRSAQPNVIPDTDAPERIEVEDERDTIVGIITRTDGLPQTFRQLDKADQTAAQQYAEDEERLAVAFGYVALRAARREARIAQRRPGAFTPPLRINAVSVTNRLQPVWCWRMRVGAGRISYRRLVYSQPTRPDNTRAERRRRLVLVRYGRYQPRILTVALAVAAILAGVAWVGWWVLTHPGEVITAALVLALLVVVLLRYRQPT